VASTGTRRRPGGFSMLLLTGASLILAGTAMLVTAADPKARDATLFGGAAPVVLGVAMVIVLAAAVATFVGRGRPVAGAGLIVMAVVFAATGIGLLTHGPSVITTGVFLLPAVITTLVLARIALTTSRGTVMR
jgi:hypothetical protein